jgi:hypothetical protein
VTELQPFLIILSITSRACTSIVMIAVTFLRSSFPRLPRTMSHSLVSRLTCFFFAARIADFWPSAIAWSAFVHSTVHAICPEVSVSCPAHSRTHRSRLVFRISL